MEVKQQQNKFWTIAAVYYQFWRFSMHMIGQKACYRGHLHNISNSSLLLVDHDS